MYSMICRAGVEMLNYDLIYWNGLILILAKIRNYIQFKEYGGITCPFQTSTVQQLKFGNG